MHDSVFGQGGGGGGLFLDQTEVQRAEKIFLETPPPPSEGLDPPMGLLILQWDKKQLTVAWNHTCLTMVLFYKNHSQQQYSTLRSSSPT